MIYALPVWFHVLQKYLKLKFGVSRGAEGEKIRNWQYDFTVDYKNLKNILGQTAESILVKNN
jgi:hypothetical protein